MDVLGRNDACPCGSGKKYKKCCLKKVEEQSRVQFPRQQTGNSVPNHSAKSTEHIHAEINQLVALFNSGRYVELENRTYLLVNQYPNAGFAWKFLGVSLLVQGKDALLALKKAAELLLDDFEAHSNLGHALHGLGQIEEAVANYRRALEINPNFVEAHYNLGNALRDLGHPADAVASYRRALEIKPDFTEAYFSLGNALRDLGHLNDAVANYRRAREIKPDFAEGHSNLGAALRYLGQFEDAVAHYRLALEFKPDYAEAQGNIGKDLRDL